MSCFAAMRELSFFCFLTVIGGYNIYVKMSISGECSRKDAVWETLEKEVTVGVSKSTIAIQRVI